MAARSSSAVFTQTPAVCIGDMNALLMSRRACLVPCPTAQRTRGPAGSGQRPLVSAAWWHLIVGSHSLTTPGCCFLAVLSWWTLASAVTWQPAPQHILALSPLLPAAPFLLCSTIVASQGQADPLSIQPPSGNATEMLVSQLAG